MLARTYQPLAAPAIRVAQCRPVLDEESLGEVASCGLNMPCPDLLTPKRAAAAVWTWAPGQPHFSVEAASWLGRLLRRWQPLRGLLSMQVPLRPMAE